jgi:hypothetical protein
MSPPRKPALIFLGLMTAVQLVNGLYHVGRLLGEGVRHGVRPFVPGAGLVEEIGLSILLAGIAWWWLAPGGRTWARWALHFLLFGWTLALVQLTAAMYAGALNRGYSWITLGVLLVLGTVGRRRSEPFTEPAPSPVRLSHPAIIGALILFLCQAPHLVFTYHWTDTTDVWACRVVEFDTSGDLSGMVNCLDPSRPPLYSVLLWLGHTNPTIEGRLLPFLMMGAFGLVVFHLLHRLTPRLAPWGILWFFLTVRVYQGAITNYADVPLMLAIGVGAFLATERELVSSSWRAVIFGIIAGAAAALIKRDGAVMLGVVTVVVVFFAQRRWSPRLYAALAGAGLGVALWLLRPAPLYVPDQYIPAVDLSAPAAVQVASARLGPELLPQNPYRRKKGNIADTLQLTPRLMGEMVYGMQGQVLSHYGYSMFVPAWIVLVIWCRRARIRLLPVARQWGWVGGLGWLAIVGLYVVNVFTGYPERATLFVIRTGFGRHLVHMFVFCLLHATVLAAALLYRSPPEAGEPA